MKKMKYKIGEKVKVSREAVFRHDTNFKKREIYYHDFNNIAIVVGYTYKKLGNIEAYGNEEWGAENYLDVKETVLVYKVLPGCINKHIYATEEDISKSNSKKKIPWRYRGDLCRGENDKK